MSTTATLTALKAAEAGLARAMDSAAAELDTVGKGPLAEALARLQAAAGAARQRLAGTLAQMRAAVAGVTAELEAAATDIWEDLSTEAFVPPEVWAAATAPPAIAELSGSSSRCAEAPTSSPDGDQQPADLPVRSCHVAQETRSPDGPAVPPTDDAPPQAAACSCDGHAAEVLTVAACPPVGSPAEAPSLLLPVEVDAGQPATPPRTRRRKTKAKGNGEAG